RGTGRAAAAQVRGVPGTLGGKTGTAQVRGAPDDGWFAGLVFDAEGRPRYTVVVYLQGGGPGGRAPAQVAGGVARILLVGEGRR
ncbi:MAG: penicillin-binding transpeptidase domain-containing protein, partial [Gemmatimonadota bacterium]|nr:penicillin-binding transpeptidase domain-containing protein [Gemmatimonadota bacterium]